MPTNSVYDIRHLELDNVGRGKRVVRPPGGEAHDIFGTSSLNGSTPSSPGSSTPGSRRGSVVDTQHRLFGQNEVKPRRVRDNLKSSIFNDDQVDHTPKPSPKRQVGPGLSSNGIMSILTASALANGNGMHTPNGSINGNGLTPASSPCPSTPVRGTPNGSRRQSIDTKNRLFNVDSSDSASSSGSLSPVPSTPVRVRQPPGGRSSIF